MKISSERKKKSKEGKCEKMYNKALKGQYCVPCDLCGVKFDGSCQYQKGRLHGVQYLLGDLPGGVRREW